ncbi:MAG: hypothetical protein RI957_2132 [Verrucomicrobiota bacterium]|jgi:hypothetical protein
MKSILFILLAFTALLNAELVFDANQKEIHAPPDATKIVCDFSFENKGDKVIKISRYESTCSCMSVQINQDGKLEYAPGEKGVIRANFDMENFTGEVKKNVVLWLEGDKDSEPSFTLVVHVIIPVLVEIQPRTLEWQGKGSWESKVMKIRMNHSHPIEIVRATVNNPCFELELKTIEKGKQYEVTVKPLLKSDVAPGMAVIHIETDCAIEKQKKQMAFVLVRPDIPSSSSRPQLSPAPLGKPE